LLQSHVVRLYLDNGIRTPRPSTGGPSTPCARAARNTSPRPTVRSRSALPRSTCSRHLQPHGSHARRTTYDARRTTAPSASSSSTVSFVRSSPVIRSRRSCGTGSRQARFRTSTCSKSPITGARASFQKEQRCHPERSARYARVAKELLWGGLREGTVLRVRFGAQNLPDWSSAVIDRQEEERRLREAKQMLDEMKRSDPGGDIKL